MIGDRVTHIVGIEIPVAYSGDATLAEFILGALRVIQVDAATVSLLHILGVGRTDVHLVDFLPQQIR